MKNCNEDFELIRELIGAEKAHTLADVFCGTILYIPKNVVMARDYRIIRDKFKKGKNYRELAREYGYTIRHVRRIIHKRMPKYE
jgi:Mor family transcriptional regulator